MPLDSLLGYCALFLGVSVGGVVVQYVKLQYYRRVFVARSSDVRLESVVKCCPHAVMARRQSAYMRRLLKGECQRAVRLGQTSPADGRSARSSFDQLKIRGFIPR